jgi:hypothetical protein
MLIFIGDCDTKDKGANTVHDHFRKAKLDGVEAARLSKYKRNIATNSNSVIGQSNKEGIESRDLPSKSVEYKKNKATKNNGSK